MLPGAHTSSSFPHPKYAIYVVYHPTFGGTINLVPHLTTRGAALSTAHTSIFYCKSLVIQLVVVATSLPALVIVPYLSTRGTALHAADASVLHNESLVVDLIVVSANLLASVLHLLWVKQGLHLWIRTLAALEHRQTH